jgi:hypothetical protein
MYYIINLHTKFQMYISDGSFIIAFKPRATENIQTAIVFLCYTA